MKSVLAFFLLLSTATAFFTPAALTTPATSLSAKKIGPKLQYAPCIPTKNIPKPGTATSGVCAGLGEFLMRVFGRWLGEATCGGGGMRVGRVVEGREKSIAIFVETGTVSIHHRHEITPFTNSLPSPPPPPLPTQLSASPSIRTVPSTPLGTSALPSTSPSPSARSQTAASRTPFLGPSSTSRPDRYRGLGALAELER